MRDESDEEYNTHEETSYYGEIDHNEDRKRISPFFQPPNTELTVKYLKIPVDHFNGKFMKWKIPCIQNTEFWEDNAPIYIFVKGNRPMRYNELKEGLMFDLANETGGVMFSLEHRYYGKEDPYKDFTYLSSEQALEDIHNVVNHIKREPEYNNSKVILVGGGYGGSLAVWLKQMYPEAADVVVASSAPLVAKANFKEYFMHVANDYKKYMPAKCTENIKYQFSTYYKCLNRTSSEESDCLKSHYPFLDICDSINMELSENKQLFYLSELFIYSDAAERSIRQMFRTCKNLKDRTRTRETSIFWDRDKSCYNFDMHFFIRNIRDKPKYRKFKRWLFQCCTEFGLFPTTSGYPKPLTSMITIDFYYKICAKLFGTHITARTINEGIKRTNRIRYGHFKPNVENVIFIYGELDPWQYGVKRLYSTTEAILIPGVSHCKDLEPKNRSDTIVLKKSRRRIIELVKLMIGFTETSREGENNRKLKNKFSKPTEWPPVKNTPEYLDYSYRDVRFL